MEPPPTTTTTTTTTTMAPQLLFETTNNASASSSLSLIHEEIVFIPEPHDVLLMQSECRTSSGRDGTMKKSVSFDKVIIREYVVIFGETIPSHGPPIGISDKYNNEISLLIEEYESQKLLMPQATNEQELRLSSDYRTNLLLSQGYSFKQVTDKSKECNQIRLSRLMSARKKTKAETLRFAISRTGKTIKDFVEHVGHGSSSSIHYHHHKNDNDDHHHHRHSHRTAST